MDFLSKDGARAWMGAHAPGADASFDRKSARAKGAISIYIEHMPPPRHLYLAREGLAWVREACDAQAPTLFWVREWGVWRAYEHDHMYTALRSAYPGSGSLEERPALVGGPDESDDVLSFLFLGLCFGWGGIIAAGGSDRTFNFDHDGVVWLTSPRQSETEAARSWLGA